MEVRASNSAVTGKKGAMLSPEERNEIRQEVYRDMADLHDEVCRRAGSYHYLCLVDGDLLFTHQPRGRVVRRLR